MSKVAGRSETSSNNLKRRGLHSICTALSEKLSVDKKSVIQELYRHNKMEQVNPASMNLGSVHGRVITSVSHGTTNTPVVLAAALSNIAEHSYAAKPSLNENHKEKERSTSSSSADSSSSDSEGEETSKAVTKEVGTGPSQAVVTVISSLTEDIKSSPRLRSQPQKYVDEINKKFQAVKSNGTPGQQKNTPKTTTPVAVRSRGRPSSARKASGGKGKEKQTPEGDRRRRGRGCGKCPGCLRNDCGTCIFCQDKPKFGGPGVKKQRCANRTCVNFVKKVPVTTRKSTIPIPIAPAPVSAASPSTTTTAVISTLDIRSFIGKTPTGGTTSTSASSQPITVASVVPTTPSSNTLQQTATGKVVAKVVSKPSPKPSPKSSNVSDKLVTPVAKVATPVAKPTGSATTPAAKPTTAAATKLTTTSAAKPTASAVTPAQQASTSPKKVTHSAAMESLIGEVTMKCVQCGRERKIGMARTEKFCTQRCIINWLEANPDKNFEDAMGNVTPTVPISITNIQSLSTSPPTAEEQKTQKTPNKPVSRALKNLQIDMALPGTKLPFLDTGDLSDDEEEKEGGKTSGSGSDEGKGRKRARLSLSTPKVVALTTRATRRSVATPTKPALKVTPAATKSGRRSTQSTPAVATPKNGTVKRGLSTSVPHPPALKKAKATTQAKPAPSTTSETPKAVTFNLGFVQNPRDNSTSTSMFSIIPIDQLSSPLGSAVNQESCINIPDDLPSNVRSWSMAQVVHYFRSSLDCRDFADLFAEQEIDGTALLLLTHEALVKCLGIKLGRAVKIMAHVETLKHIYEAAKSQ